MKLDLGRDVGRKIRKEGELESQSEKEEGGGRSTRRINLYSQRQNRLNDEQDIIKFFAVGCKENQASEPLSSEVTRQKYRSHKRVSSCPSNRGKSQRKKQFMTKVCRVKFEMHRYRRKIYTVHDIYKPQLYHTGIVVYRCRVLYLKMENT